MKIKKVKPIHVFAVEGFEPGETFQIGASVYMMTNHFDESNDESKSDTYTVVNLADGCLCAVYGGRDAIPVHFEELEVKWGL